MTADAAGADATAVLTMDKLRVYRSFGGDHDGWARRGQHAGMHDGDWQLIESLRQDLFLVAAGRASPAFASATERRLRDAVDREETRQALRELARSETV